jgi:hypothetical protein
MGQNSPVPSPYTPQSPAPGYMQQYPHPQQPPSYSQHQQIQQGEANIHCYAISGWSKYRISDLNVMHILHQKENVQYKFFNIYLVKGLKALISVFKLINS